MSDRIFPLPRYLFHSFLATINHLSLYNNNWMFSEALPWKKTSTCLDHIPNCMQLCWLRLKIQLWLNLCTEVTLSKYQKSIFVSDQSRKWRMVREIAINPNFTTLNGHCVYTSRTTHYNFYSHRFLLQYDINALEIQICQDIDLIYGYSFIVFFKIKSSSE